MHRGPRTDGTVGTTAAGGAVPARVYTRPCPLSGPPTRLPACLQARWGRGAAGFCGSTCRWLGAAHALHGSVCQSVSSPKPHSSPLLLILVHLPRHPTHPPAHPAPRPPRAAKLHLQLVSILSRGDDEFAATFCDRLEDEYAVFKVSCRQAGRQAGRQAAGLGWAWRCST